MAVVPGVLYITDRHGYGGLPGIGTTDINSSGDSILLNLRDRRLDHVTPDDEATFVPIASVLDFYPWYDGSAGPTNYTVASSTTTTITATGAGWTVNQWAGRQILVCNTTPIAGLGYANRMLCVSNTSDTLTFAALAGAPTVGALFHLGVGRFTDYFAAGGGIHVSEIASGSQRGGDCWQNLGVGLGPTASLIPALFSRVYTTAPYFHCFKWVNLTQGVITSWADSPNDGARAGFLAELARVATAATERGDTTAWQFAIVDLSSLDLVTIATTPALLGSYLDRISQMIAWLRSAAVMNNPTAKIILVSHRSDLMAVTYPGVYPTLVSIHTHVARTDTGVGVLSMNGAYPAIHNIAIPQEIAYYSVTEYLRMGERLADMIVRMSLDAAPEVEGGMPVYMLLGDSHAAGVTFPEWTESSWSPRISGQVPGSLVRPANQMVWNRSTRIVETYEPHTNSNMSGSVSALAGPDLSIMAALGELHPGGFVLIKRGANGSALATERVVFAIDSGGGVWAKSAGEQYDALKADFDACTQYINEVMGKQADLRGIFVSLGHNDQVTAGGGAAFATELPQFCDDLWDDFSTRTSGRQCPIIWRRPEASSAESNPTRIAEVRAALALQATLRPQFRLVDVDDLERNKLDNLHEAPETTVIVGERMTAALARIAI